jgi:hypothetical protein
MADAPQFNWPQLAARADGWATVDSQTPRTNYWNTSPASDGGMRAGAGEHGGQTETLINFTLPAELAGAAIHSARLQIQQTGVSACPSTPLSVYAPAAALTAQNATWLHWSGVKLGAPLDTQTPAGCRPDYGFELDVTAAVAAGRTSQTLVLKNADPRAWKEFDTTSPALIVQYNHAPDQPTALATAPTTSCAADPPTVIGDGDLSLYFPVSDPDGGAVGASVEVARVGSDTPILRTDPADTTYSSGSRAVALVRVDAMRAVADADGMTDFTWRARVTDYQQTSAWSPTCRFTYDTNRPGTPTLATDQSAVQLGKPITYHVTPSATGPLPANYIYQLNTAGGVVVKAAPDGSADITVKAERFTNVLVVYALSIGGNPSSEVSTIFNADASPRPASGDMDGDGHADLVVAGGTHGLPSGLWLTSGDGSGGFARTPVNIGVNGTWFSNTGADYDGAQVVTGWFDGQGPLDVFAYSPARPMGFVLAGNGDSTPLRPVSGRIYSVTGDALADGNGATPTQLVATEGITNEYYPDLIGISSGSLTYYPTWGGTGSYFEADTLTAQLTPTGGTDWDSWTIVASGTTVFLWQSSTGTLYAWHDLTFDRDNATISYTQSLLSSDWNTGQSLTLQATDINEDGTADLWTVGDNATATAWLTDGQTITAGPSHTIVTR